jgi:hypothetical protein
MNKYFILFVSALLLISCDCEKDISKSEDVAFLINKDLTLRDSVFIVRNKHLDMDLLEIPGSYGMPTLEEHFQGDNSSEDKGVVILGVLDKGTVLSLEQVTRRRPLFNEEQLLVWSNVNGKKVVINPVFDTLSLPENPYEKVFDRPHFLSLLDY